MDPLLNTVTELFVKMLDTEIHEKVLCQGLEMFSLWAIHLTRELPQKYIDVFKKGMESKSATQFVRVSYLQWLLACLENSNLPAGADISQALIKIVEKASQNVTQISLLSEAICAVCILLRTETSTTADGANKLQSFWSVVLDMTKQVFVSEKFISSAPNDTLAYVMLMSKILLTEHYAKLKGPPEPLFKAIIYSTNSSKKVRNYCLPHVRELVQSSNGVDISRHLFLELAHFIQTSKVHAEGDTADENNVSGQSVAESIRAYASINLGSSADSQIIALSSLISCHHPCVVAHTPSLWEQILTTLELDAKSFISLNSKQIKINVVDNYKPIPIFENTVATLCKLSPEVMIPIVVEQVTTHLKNPEMSCVTDDEYFMFLTPDGELYDKSVIPNADDIYKDLSNKRENKVYTYKEQLEEIQLRREIEEKKRKEGKWIPPQLTPKQQEAIKNQTDKEKAIKNKLKTLNDNLSQLVSLIHGARSGNPKQLSLYCCQLLTNILRVLKSPLAAIPLTKLYYDLRLACFFDGLEELGEQLAILTLRLHEPHCDLEEKWTRNNLSEEIENVMQLFVSETSDESDDTEGSSLVEASLLTAPAFCYGFEFLKKAVFFKNLSKNEQFLLYGIQLIGKHAQIKGTTPFGDLSDYRHPKYMPRHEMMALLMQLIEIHRGRIQTQAVAALLDVATSSSGNEYCAYAGRQEIECLLVALQNHLEAVRDVALRALTTIMKTLPTMSDDYEFGLRLTRRLWIAKHDVSEENRDLANTLWEDGKFEVPIVLCDELLKDVIHPEPCIQKAAAFSLVSILKDDPSLVQGVLDQLLEIYYDKLTKIPAKLDQFDREIEPAIDQWSPRRGVAIAICQIAQFFNLSDVDKVMQFMVSKGLGDREEIVHKEMLAAALTIVDLHGKETIAKLLPVFEDFLDKAPKSSVYDNIRQAVVILMGSLARHLDKEDQRIQPIVKRLLAALSTPSQQVQEAVANCIPHLMPSVKDESSSIIKKLLNQLVKSEKYGERRGAAYGIAGVVKGLGILSLKQLDIMSKLTHHIQEKKNYKSREGALFAFEMLCTTLGRLFEPYIVHVLPHLLQCFGDSSQYVRQAADDTAKVVMGKLSAHGVKLVLPSLLNALDEDSWRTKTASVELLGAMAYCAPKQLSSCLPSIVPKLIEVLGDSHTKVQEAGGDALKVIGSVIKNPEIQAIVPVLLKALEDPSANTSKCLQSLLETKFVHFIDAPSLALIMPVVQRAFMDRSTETRKMAAQIIGNMYSLTDQKDLTPYLPNIIPGLKTSLLDPVPEVRAVSARALGAMVSSIELIRLRCCKINRYVLGERYG